MDNNFIARRRFMKMTCATGLGLGMGLGCRNELAASEKSDKPSKINLPTTPIAQEYSIIHSVKDPEVMATGIGDFAKLPSGRLLASTPDYPWRYSRKERLKYWEAHGSVIKASDDNGKTWYKAKEKAVPTLSYKDRLYRFICVKRGDFEVSASDDNGKTWSEKQVVVAGRFSPNSSQYVIRDNTVYLGLGMQNKKGEWNNEGSRSMAIAGDLTKDLCDPKAWRTSKPLTYPGTPDLLNRDLYDDEDHHLEPNLVQYKDQLYVYWRVRIDDQGTAGITAICDLEDDGTVLDYKFGQFHPLPGAQNMFNIQNDPKTGLYWLFSNPVTHTQDPEWNKLIEENGWFKTPLGGHERRILTLHVSFDALNWLPAAYLVVMPHMHQAANYVKPLIDGNDLIFASRTCINGPNSHDADTATFHRVHDFRKLAEPLIPLWPDGTPIKGAVS